MGWYGQERTSVAAQLVAPGEGPRAGDLQNLGVARDLRRKRRVRRRHLDDAHGGGIEHPLSGAAVDDDLLDRAVGAYRDREDHAAVQPQLPCRLRIVEVADALDLLPPVLDVPGEAVLRGAGTDL